jgi:hypothetical protein
MQKDNLTERAILEYKGFRKISTSPDTKHWYFVNWTTKQQLRFNKNTAKYSILDKFGWTEIEDFTFEQLVEVL